MSAWDSFEELDRKYAVDAYVEDEPASLGIVDRLNALDDKFGVGPHRQITPKQWERAMRRWWVGPLAAFLGILFIPTLYPELFERFLMAGPAFVAASFSGGFLYNERLRSLGKTSRFRSFRPPAVTETETPYRL